MLIGFLRRGRRVAMVPGSIGPKGAPDQPPNGYAWEYTFDGHPSYNDDGTRRVVLSEG